MSRAWFKMAEMFPSSCQVVCAIFIGLVGLLIMFVLPHLLGRKDNEKYDGADTSKVSFSYCGA